MSHELYIPRRCHASNNLISAKDKGSITLYIAEIKEDGQYALSCKPSNYVVKLEHWQKVTTQSLDLQRQTGCVLKATQFS